MNPHRSLLFVSLLAACTALGAREIELSFAQESSIPPHLIEAFKKSRSAEQYVFSTLVNPFYIQGDFNGDGRLDCAILVKQKLSGKLGIAIVHAGESNVRVLGAGHSFGNGGDDFAWLDAWYAYSKAQVQSGADGGPPPKLKGDALMVIKTEAASSLIYWTGTQYRWYQQGD
jgi:hypothetical protein